MSAQHLPPTSSSPSALEPILDRTRELRFSEQRRAFLIAGVTRNWASNCDSAWTRIQPLIQHPEVNSGCCTLRCGAELPPTAVPGMTSPSRLSSTALLSYNKRMTVLSTGRLILRRWRESDREPFAKINSDPGILTQDLVSWRERSFH